jgi:hypothetical protein
MPKKRPLRSLAMNELEAMPTRQLLARRTRLLKCEECRAASDIDDNDPRLRSGEILFKDSPTWKLAYLDVKSVLARREHIPR